jgi:hypothetical protein
MKRSWQISRRTLLGGAGALLGLPLLEQMGRVVAHAGPSATPANLVVWHFPTSWTPTPGAIVSTSAASGTLTSGAIGPVLGSINSQNLLGDAVVVTNVTNQPAYADQAGDHARGVGALLTCQQPTLGVLNVGPSMDFVAAATLGKGAKLSSIQIGTNNDSPPGDCDSGYPCPDQFSTSWSAPAVPAPVEIDPGKAFARLFAGFDPNASAAEVMKRLKYKTSILDYAQQQSTSLRAKLNPRDQAKLDQYFSAVRDFETRLASAPMALTCTPGASPGGVPADIRDHVKLMSDLTVLALQCGVTPVITFSYENTVSEIQHTFLQTAAGQQVTDGWHIGITHHNGDAFKISEQQAVNTWLVDQYCYLAAKMKTVTLPDGKNLLDHTIMLGVSDMGDQAHNHSNMRPLIFGGSALGVKTGRMIANANEVALSNVYVGVLQALGVGTTSFGDSNGSVQLT